jgi:Spy/CpxP family protein refolding chaperone
MTQKRKENKMLKLRSKGIVLPIAALILVAGTAFAQPPGMQEQSGGRKGMHDCEKGGHGPMIPGLSEGQHEQIKALKVEHMESMLSLRNEFGEHKARLRTLTTKSKVNMTEVNRVIDQIGALRTRMMKQRVAHQQSIRELLTDEQRVFFDAHHPPHDGPPHEGKHTGKGMHR